MHPLLEPAVLAAVGPTVAAHVGGRWVRGPFVPLDERASHPCGVFLGPVRVFAKLGVAAQFRAELAGLELLRRRAGIATPVPVGIVDTPAGAVLLCEALRERAARTPADWRAIGRTLAALHAVPDERFGSAAGNGFFGPLEQDNRPCRSNRWSDFYAERRVLPLLRTAVDSGHLPADLAAGVERLAGRLSFLCGPEPTPSLLHGDAQSNNFVSTDGGAVVIDASPYFGHPELDLALVAYFEPVPDEVFAGYRDAAAIDPGFAERRELWRVSGYLAVIAVDGHSPFGRTFLDRLAAALSAYR